jgi:hypothetical protein
MLTGWTADFFHLMLHNLQEDFWDVVHLNVPCLLMQVELAGFTMSGAMRNNLIRSQNLQEGVSWMSFLAARALFTLFSLLSRFASQSITG